MFDTYYSTKILFCIAILFSFSVHAQVGIGTTEPDSNTVLDVYGTDKGMLIPRVALTRTTTASPLSTPIEPGIIVYNTANRNDVSPGFYYNDGSKWVRIMADDGTSSTDEAWALDGNTVSGTDFIGTINNQPLRIRVENKHHFTFTQNGKLRGHDDGTPLQPTYSWNGAAHGQNMGMYRIGQGILGFSTDGQERVRIIKDGKVLIGRNSTGGGGYMLQVRGIDGIRGDANESYVGVLGTENPSRSISLPSYGAGVAGFGGYVGTFGRAYTTTNNRSAGVLGYHVGTNATPMPTRNAGVAGIGTTTGVYAHATSSSGYGVYSEGHMRAIGEVTATQKIETSSGSEYARLEPGGWVRSSYGVESSWGSGWARMWYDGRIVSNNKVEATNDVDTWARLYRNGNIEATGIISGTISPRGGVSGTGDLSMSGVKNFMIDHPQDPANRYLKHASIESDEILNLYRGTETFDGSGRAVVRLPDYYDAVNINPAYQLTPIGAPMPNLYIEQEVRGGTFIIAGGVAGKKVNWILTAERNDPYLQQNPDLRKMEVDKGDKRGKYLTPELYGRPEQQGIYYHEPPVEEVKK